MRSKILGETVTLRLSPEMLKHIDARVATMREAAPGASVTRADVIRTMLLKAMEHEKPQKRR